MTTPIRRMVVGVGLLGRHDPVLQIAAGIAREHGAELHVVHAFDPRAPVEIAYARRAGDRMEQPEKRKQTIGEFLCAHGRTLTEPVRLVCHAVEGTASECLVDRAHEVGADLLIVGATRQDRVRRHFVGTTAQGVIAEGVVPVLLIWQPVVRPLKRVLLASNLSDQSTQICGRGLEILRSLFPDDLPELRCLLALRPLIARVCSSSRGKSSAAACGGSPPWNRESGMATRGSASRGRRWIGEPISSYSAITHIPAAAAVSVTSRESCCAKPRVMCS
jgi:universal stress protein A